jgi:hypothetical protein
MSVPAASLHDGTLLKLVSGALEESGLAAERLEIDLHEPAMAADPTDSLLIIAAA